MRWWVTRHVHTNNIYFQASILGSSQNSSVTTKKPILSSLPHNVLCTALENSLCAPAQHHQAEVFPGGQCLGILGVLWMHLGCEHTRYSYHLTILQKVMCACKILATIKKEPLHCWTHPGIAGTAEPVCWCLPVLTLAAVVAAGLPLLMCHWSSLQLCVLASTWKECSVINWNELSLLIHAQSRTLTHFPIPEKQHTDVEVKLLQWKKEELITAVFEWRKIPNQSRLCDFILTTFSQTDPYLIYSIDHFYV